MMMLTLLGALSSGSAMESSAPRSPITTSRRTGCSVVRQPQDKPRTSSAVSAPPQLLLLLSLPLSLLLAFSLLESTLCEAAVWQDNVQPKLRIDSLPANRVLRFRSEQDNDHFRLLDHDGEYLLIGAKNMVYNVSAVTLDVRRRLEWRPSDSDVKMCRLKGKSEASCHNYIRVIAKKAHDRVLVCGTNAYKPKCRDYALLPSGPSPHADDPDEREFILTEEKPGEGLCPYDPNHNSTFTFAAPLGHRTDGALYAGTAGQFSGADPLIYRKPLRTEQFDLKHLNAPQFVSSMHLGGFVYFFFRESAVEYINCGKAVYSRVARVCTNDQGGPHKFKERFTSFLKARLNCSIPGDMPFYFDELQSTSPIVEGSYRGERARLIYSVLTTGTNSISGSAVCAFRLDDIDAAFHGAFKGQDDKNSNWLPVINSKIPEPRPGQCVNNSKSLPDATLNFITNHPLMDQAVPAYMGGPVVVHTGFSYRYTYIAVDGQVEAVSGKAYDVLFIGTDHGHVLKVVNVLASLPADGAEGQDKTDSNNSNNNNNNNNNDRYHRARPVVVEDVLVFGRHNEPPPGRAAPADSLPGPVAVTNLVVQRLQPSPKLIVVSKSEIQAVPLFHCQRAQSCASCVALQDPYCAWSLDDRMCTHNWRQNRQSSVQSVERGWDERCGANSRPHPNFIAIVGDEPRGSRPGSGDPGEHDENQNAAHLAGTRFTSSRIYSSETLAIAVTTSIVTSLVVGFIGGYIFARRCRNVMDTDSGPDDYTRYVGVNRMTGRLIAAAATTTTTTTTTAGGDLGGIPTAANAAAAGYGGGHYESTYMLPPPLPPGRHGNVIMGGPRPVNLVVNGTGKPVNCHLLSSSTAAAGTMTNNYPKSNGASSPMTLNGCNMKTTVQKVKKIYL